MMDYIKLLVFDALIGNNDRHFYNWAIIRDVRGKSQPVFSPIYDTARGLFWNDHEDKLKWIYDSKSRLETFIKKYAEGSSPKIGWDGLNHINHFDLVEKLRSLPFTVNCETIINVCSDESLLKVYDLIDNEFRQLLSFERRYVIKACLAYRHDRIKKIFNFAT
ncbi:MAG TPA: hypothetical protein VE912_11635 [Bacteroidales bacterium]|nr:hypothetical protein [Bacteroidales bacterium]